MFWQALQKFDLKLVEIYFCFACRRCCGQLTVAVAWRCSKQFSRWLHLFDFSPHCVFILWICQTFLHNVFLYCKFVWLFCTVCFHIVNLPPADSVPSWLLLHEDIVNNFQRLQKWTLYMYTDPSNQCILHLKSICLIRRSLGAPSESNFKLEALWALGFFWLCPCYLLASQVVWTTQHR